MKEEIEVITGSGNVFADMGLPESWRSEWAVMGRGRNKAAKKSGTKKGVQL